MILSICFGSLLFGLCVYVFSCELMVRDPMPFNNCNFRFIFQKKQEKKVMLKKKKKRKIKSCCKIKEKKVKRKKAKRKIMNK